MPSVFNKSIPELRRWSPRRPVSARHLNEPVDAINRMTRGILPPRMVSEIDRAGERAVAIGGAQVQRLFLALPADEKPDYLICRAIDSNPSTFERILIAKPWKLRQTPFHAQSRDGFTYFYFRPTRRQKTRESDGEIEQQLIIPRYQTLFDRVPDFGDQLFAVHNPIGGTGVVADLGGEEPVPVEWIELNDGRAWSKVSE